MPHPGRSHGPDRRHCAVLGDPIGHSLSPVLHRAGYAALGLDWTYDAHRVPAGTLATWVSGLDDEWRGLSLTMPLKREAVALLDQMTDLARLAGAVNTVVVDDAGLHGDNTDIPGASAAIRERSDVVPRRAAVLGGGATAASLGLALAGLGCVRIELLVRNPERAEETRRVIAAHPDAPEVVVGAIGGGAPVVADLVASTVPPSAQDEALLRRLAGVPVVFEALYDPWPTPLADAAGDRVLVSGLDLLVHQAALQFELFTGRPAPLTAMRDAGITALAGRSSR